MLFTKLELEYVTGNEFQHPQTRAEKRRAEKFKKKWAEKSGKDALFREEVIKLLTGLKNGTITKENILKDVAETMGVSND